jgi:hypothetical protein
MTRKLFAIAVLITLLAALSLGTVAQTLRAPNYISNEGFEAGLTDWTRANQKGDKVVCTGDDNFQAYLGDCAFLFKASTGDKASLKAVATSAFVTDFNAALQSANATVSFGFVRYSESAGTRLITKLIVSISDGNRVVRKIVTTGGSAPDIRGFNWASGERQVEFSQNLVITKARLKFIDKSSSGKQWLDSIQLLIVS